MLQSVFFEPIYTAICLQTIISLEILLGVRCGMLFVHALPALMLYMLNTMMSGGLLQCYLHCLLTLLLPLLMMVTQSGNWCCQTHHCLMTTWIAHQIDSCYWHATLLVYHSLYRAWEHACARSVLIVLVHTPSWLPLFVTLSLLDRVACWSRHMCNCRHTGCGHPVWYVANTYVAANLHC